MTTDMLQSALSSLIVYVLKPPFLSAEPPLRIRHPPPPAMSRPSSGAFSAKDAFEDHNPESLGQESPRSSDDRRCGSRACCLQLIRFASLFVLARAVVLLWCMLRCRLRVIALRDPQLSEDENEGANFKLDIQAFFKSSMSPHARAFPIKVFNICNPSHMHRLQPPACQRPRRRCGRPMQSHGGMGCTRG